MPSEPERKALPFNVRKKQTVVELGKDKLTFTRIRGKPNTFNKEAVTGVEFIEHGGHEYEVAWLQRGKLLTGRSHSNRAGTEILSKQEAEEIMEHIDPLGRITSYLHRGK